MKYFTAAALLGASALLLSGCMATNPDTLMRKQVVWLHADGMMVPHSCNHDGWMQEKASGKKHHRHHAAKKESAAVKSEKKAEPKKEPARPAVKKSTAPAS